MSANMYDVLRRLTARLGQLGQSSLGVRGELPRPQLVVVAEGH
jgi:hypothetical protein